jgi:hypothetical protein
MLELVAHTAAYLAYLDVIMIRDTVILRQTTSPKEGPASVSVHTFMAFFLGSIIPTSAARFVAFMFVWAADLCFVFSWSVVSNNNVTAGPLSTVAVKSAAAAASSAPKNSSGDTKVATVSGSPLQGMGIGPWAAAGVGATGVCRIINYFKQYTVFETTFRAYLQ